MRLLPRVREEMSQNRFGEISAERTYLIDFSNGRILRKCDGLEALYQAISKILRTCWRTYDIYDDEYGLEMQGMIGRDYSYVKSELKRRIMEALMSDERIDDVGGFVFPETVKGEEMPVKFTVYSKYGKIDLQRAVDFRLGERNE